MNQQVEINLTVNGAPHKAKVEPRKLLSDVLREDLGLTGTHTSCELGVCGVCSIVMDGQLVRSCLTFGVQADGSTIETVEALQSDNGTLSVLHQAFKENHSLQCGFCTPGFLVTLKALFDDKPAATDDEIDEALDGVLCRCTGYENITKAARQALDAVAAG